MYLNGRNSCNSLFCFVICERVTFNGDHYELIFRLIGIVHRYIYILLYRYTTINVKLFYINFNECILFIVFNIFIMQFTI